MKVTRYTGKIFDLSRYLRYLYITSVEFSLYGVVAKMYNLFTLKKLIFQDPSDHVFFACFRDTS